MSIENFGGLAPEMVERKSIVANLEGKVLDKNHFDEILPEHDRSWLREHLTKAGVDLKPFLSGEVSIEGREYKEEGKKGYTEKDALYKAELKAQSDFVLAALGKDRFLRMVSMAVVTASEKPGGKIADGLSQADLAEFVDGYLRKKADAKTGFVYSPKTEAEKSGIEWHTNAIYRIEAVVSVAYSMLAMAVKDGEESAKFQVGSRIEKFFRQRIIRGERRSLNAREMKVPRHLLEKKTDEANIRHLPAGGVLNVIVAEMVQ